MIILNRWLSDPDILVGIVSKLQLLRIKNSQFKILNYQSTDYTTILLHDYTKNRQQKPIFTPTLKVVLKATSFNSSQILKPAYFLWMLKNKKVAKQGGGAKP